MIKTEALHREAIELADLAELARLRGDSVTAGIHLRKAYEKERAAANEVASDYAFEPTRSVLLRSAASFALEVNELRESERLISLALSGNPPDEIADELRDLLEQVHFSRHLVLRGVELAPNEIQFSMTGDDIGFGFAKANTFSSRAESIERALFRTAERVLGKSYRERGRREKKIKDRVEVYLSEPRAASFAVTFRLGHSPQIEVPGASFGEIVVDEFLDLLELFDAGDPEKLAERISEPAYLRNFVGLAKRIVPDGQAVKMVGFSTNRRTGPRIVALQTTRDEFEGSEEMVDLAVSKTAGSPSEPRSFVGRLLFADELSDKNTIQILEPGGKQRRLYVPTGMMADIVSPMWEQTVKVRAVKKGNRLVLVDIRPVDEE